MDKALLSVFLISSMQLNFIHLIKQIQRQKIKRQIHQCINTKANRMSVNTQPRFQKYDFLPQVSVFDSVLEIEVYLKLKYMESGALYVSMDLELLKQVSPVDYQDIRKGKFAFWIQSCFLFILLHGNFKYVMFIPRNVQTHIFYHA